MLMQLEEVEAGHSLQAKVSFQLTVKSNEKMQVPSQFLSQDVQATSQVESLKL